MALDFASHLRLTWALHYSTTAPISVGARSTVAREHDRKNILLSARAHLAAERKVALNELIYDVGVNDGTDSAYYLWRGYRVLGIEASPVLAEKLREKFAPEIREGRYTLLDVGVADDDGTAEFWMSDVTEWSIFQQECSIARRDASSRRANSNQKILLDSRRVWGSVLLQAGY